MIHQSVNDLHPDTSSLIHSPTTADSFKLSNSDVNAHIIAKKLACETLDSGYASRNNFGCNASQCVNDSVCDSKAEFSFDENARLSFDEVNDSTYDMDTSTMSCREIFGKLLILYVTDFFFFFNNCNELKVAQLIYTIKLY